MLESFLLLPFGIIFRSSHAPLPGTLSAKAPYLYIVTRGAAGCAPRAGELSPVFRSAALTVDFASERYLFDQGDRPRLARLRGNLRGAGIRRRLQHCGALALA
jgi:hypothetical protein